MPAFGIGLRHFDVNAHMMALHGYMYIKTKQKVADSAITTIQGQLWKITGKEARAIREMDRNNVQDNKGGQNRVEVFLKGRKH